MFRTLWMTMTLLTISSVAQAAESIYFSPAVPTDPTAAEFFLPWEVRLHEGQGYAPSVSLSTPGRTAINALHKLDRPGGWLVALAAPSDLDGALPAFAQPRDLLRFDQDRGFTAFFCGALVDPPVRPETRIDAVFLDPPSGGDLGDLILSLDRPSEFPAGSGQFRAAADLLRFVRSGPGCGDWSLAGVEFDAALAGDGIPTSSNVIGAARHGELILLVLDIPTRLTTAPGSSAFFIPGQVIAWDGSVFSLFDSLPAWPISSRVTGVSGRANPGSVGAAGADGLRLDKAGSELRFEWSTSCSDGASDYAVYEGSIGVWYDHAPLLCSTGGQTDTQTSVSAGDRFYLVVPLNSTAEGSHGVDSHGVERPAPFDVGDRCAPLQVSTPCA